MATNGHDKEESEKKDKRIISFPSRDERDRMRQEKEKKKEEKKKEKKPGGEPPMFNVSRIPVLTRTIIILFLLVHLPLYLLMSATDRFMLFSAFGFVPGIYTGIVPWSWHGLVSPFTHIFIHGSWFHLLINTTMMLAMGMFMETVFGSRRMLVFFVFSGLCGALCYFVFLPFSVNPVVGASGSISGLFAVTILILHEQGRLGSGEKKSALPLLLFWVALTIGIGLIGGGIAWQAHLGGFLGALGLFQALKRKWINF